MASVSKKMGRVATVSNEPKHGYFLYSDGTSRWGINTYRGMELGVEISQEQHTDKELDKVKLHQELTSPKKEEVEA
jgi:hypothetical protein